MSPAPETRYPNRLSYVLRLRGDATPDALAGRLENVVTGRRFEFASAGALLEALAGEIEADAHEAPGE
jgi:hypothetical protein